MVKPDIGAKPAFLDDGDHVSLGTTAAYKRCVEALKNSKPYAAGALDDYCAAFATNLERFRLSKPDGEFDDAVIKILKSSYPFGMRSFRSLRPWLSMHPPQSIYRGCTGSLRT